MDVNEPTVTVLRGTGLKDSISRDKVVKSPSPRSTMEDATPSVADSHDDGGADHIATRWPPLSDKVETPSEREGYDERSEKTSHSL